MVFLSFTCSSALRLAAQAGRMGLMNAANSNRAGFMQKAPCLGVGGIHSRNLSTHIVPDELLTHWKRVKSHLVGFSKRTFQMSLFERLNNHEIQMISLSTTFFIPRNGTWEGMMSHIYILQPEELTATLTKLTALLQEDIDQWPSYVPNANKNEALYETIPCSIYPNRSIEVLTGLTQETGHRYVVIRQIVQRPRDNPDSKDRISRSYIPKEYIPGKLHFPHLFKNNVNDISFFLDLTDVTESLRNMADLMIPRKVQQSEE